MLRSTNDLIGATSLDQRRLDRKAKELLSIATLTVLRMGKAHLQSHTRTAPDPGVSKEEILEATEITPPGDG